MVHLFYLINSNCKDVKLMGAICVKGESKHPLQSPDMSSMSARSPLNSIQTKMDKSEYQRLQIIKECLNNSSSTQKSLKQLQAQRQIGDFKFVRHLGDGSYGEVLMVKDLRSNEFYAMKIIRKELIIQREEILNALSERYILAAMNHPFVVKLHYAFQTKNKIYLIVDLMAGGELFYLLRKNKKFDEDTAKFYAAQILLALEYLHTKKIIYRDLKPQNILLDRQGHVKLTDFGLSKVCLKKNEVATSVCGTPEYIAPQVLKGKGYTLAADWFSFGSLLYDMLTGKPPFYSKDKDQMMHKIQTNEIPFPDYLSTAAKSLLKSLFEKKQQNRIGFKTDATEIKKHEFFKPVNFDDIYNRKIKPPFSFEENINSEGFAVKFDEFQVGESYEKQLVQQSKGVNFEGFTYQVKAGKFPESKVEVNEFSLNRKQSSQKQAEFGNEEVNDVQMELNIDNQVTNTTKQADDHIQNLSTQQKDKDKKLHKRSTFSMSIHELEKKSASVSPEKQDAKQSAKQLQMIKEYEKHSFNINETLLHEEMQTPNLVVSPNHHEAHSPLKKEMSFQHKDDFTTEQTIKK